VVGGVRGRTLFAGYLDDADTTEASFRDGWFLTGDRATRDADGRWYFDGRRSDVLKVSGENVSTVEVEGVLAAHPGVLEASVVGAPDEVRDEVPVAFVVPSDPKAPPTVPRNSPRGALNGCPNRRFPRSSHFSTNYLEQAWAK
jgi:crotonobetaine/carnitine-CoA ligase